MNQPPRPEQRPPDLEELRMDAATVRRWCSAAVDALGAHRDEIDRLNVYPVPDGDTGTNMLLTLRAMIEALRRERPRSLPAAAAVMARGALMGARGNSGVILSQFVRGMGERLGQLRDGVPVTDGPRILAGALSRGAELARAGVADPVEGTILTVADEAAAAAEQAAATAPSTMEGIAAVSTAAARGAAQALERTPELLPTLARAGVVDAGGKGLCIILDALASVTGGTPAGGVSWARSTQARAADSVPTTDCAASDFGYEVVYLLEATAAAVEPLRSSLREIGDSLVLVGAGDDSDGARTSTWKVHIHVNDVGAAIERGIEAGRPHGIEVTRFADQVGAPRLRGVAIVAIAPGDALRTVFVDEGAFVVDSGANRSPSTAEVLDAITRASAAHVVVLPNDGDATAVADAAASEARSEGVDVAVLPTSSVVQGLAALAVHDPERRFSDDVISMAEAAAGTRHAAVTVAAREALTMAGTCHPGDVLGIVGGDVVVIGDSILGVSIELLDRMLALGGEMVTFVVGRRAPDGLADDVRQDLLTRHPEIEFLVLDSGHADHPVLLGVE